MRDNRRTRAVLVVLLLTSLTLIALNGNSGPGRALRSGAGAVFGPVQRVAASAFRPIHDFFAGAGKDQQAEIDKLKKENDALRALERTNAYNACRAGEYAALWHIAGVGGYQVLPAQVIAKAPEQTLARTVEISSGARNGLAAGMTVINGDGLVGKIASVTSTTATVQLALDQYFNVGVRVEGTLQGGYVKGMGDDPMLLTMFDGTAVLKPGDRLVTDFRADSVFAAGIPVGTITTVSGTVGSLERMASVKTYVNFTALDVVGVIVLNPTTDPGVSVLPPKPSPGVTPPSSCGSPAIAATTASPTSSSSASSSSSQSASASTSTSPTP
jgi:rod shape-determining protein MreC